MSIPQFEDPATFVGIDFNEVNGSLLMFQVQRFEEHIHTVHTEPGEKSPAIAATVTVLDGGKAGSVYEDALIFPKVLIGQLRPRVGRVVLGRLVQGEAVKGKTAPWTLLPATDQDRANATAFLASRAVNGSTTPAPTPAPQQGFAAAPPF
jgi:hypothetical protein